MNKLYKKITSQHDKKTARSSSRKHAKRLALNLIFLSYLRDSS